MVQIKNILTFATYKKYNDMEKLAYVPKYFTLAELVRSYTAEKECISNVPSFMVVDNLRELCKRILDPLRLLYGAPVTVTSGYRSRALNAAVGGVRNSQHLTGMAADIISKDTRKLFKLLQTDGIIDYVDQCLYEKSNKSVWVHVSWSFTPRHQIIDNYLTITRK